MRNPLPFLFCAFALGFVGNATADPLIQPHDLYAICGDSITEQHIYSVDLEDYALMCHPVEGQGVVQFGWSGEQAVGFFRRLDTDVLPFKPTVATTCYGMNDGGYKAFDQALADTYRTFQTNVVEALKKNGVHSIVIGSAKCVDSALFRDGPEKAAIYNKTLGQYADIDKDIAAKESVIYADVYGETVKAMEKSKAQYGDKYNFGGGDGVHPGPNGHLVMAYAFLKALGYDGAIGTITVDLDANKADGTDGQKVVSFQNGTVSLESTRYPFCFSGQAGSQDPNATAGILKSVPFNDDLNRYLLVVKGLKTATAKVTWGTETKEFPAADLAKGVNLAAEFLTNPFSDQFFKVEAAIRAQQGQETMLSKEFMHNLAAFKQMAPGSADGMDKIVQDGMAQREKLYQAAVALVVPIQHTIKIEPGS